jgi:hypothetical protein
MQFRSVPENLNIHQSVPFLKSQKIDLLLIDLLGLEIL